MRSFVFNGADFKCLTRVKAVEKRALSVVPKTAVVPNHASEAFLDVRAVLPKIVRLKLLLEPMANTDEAQMAGPKVLPATAEHIKARLLREERECSFLGWHAYQNSKR